MSVYSGPEITNDGLVFAYDMGNSQKSWRGAPTTNLLTNGNFSNGVISPFGTYNVTPVTVSGISPLPYSNYSSNYVMQFTSTTGTSGTSLDVNGKCTVGQTYTFSFYGRLFTGPSSTVGLSFNNQNGSGDTNAWNSNVTLTNNWQKFTFTFTYDVAKIMLYFYTSATGYICQFTDFQLEQLSVSSPFVNGTRTNTQAILDQTNNRTVTTNSLTYASDGTFSFNGSTNHITTTNTGITHGTTNFSYSCWAKWSGKPSLGTLFENGSWTSSFLIRFETNGITIYSMGAYYGKFSFDPTLNIWYHLAFVRNGNSIELYVNGVFYSSLAFGTNVDIVPNTNLIFIGMSQHAAGQCFTGQIAKAQIHNRAISAAEVLNNFNAHRGRFNI